MIRRSSSRLWKKLNSNISNNNTNRISCIYTCNAYTINKHQIRTIATSNTLKSSKGNTPDNSSGSSNSSPDNNTHSSINNATNNTNNNINDNINNSSKIHPSVAENIGNAAKNYTFELNKVYMEAEKNLMIR